MNSFGISLARQSEPTQFGICAFILVCCRQSPVIPFSSGKRSQSIAASRSVRPLLRFDLLLEARCSLDRSPLYQPLGTPVFIPLSDAVQLQGKHFSPICAEPCLLEYST